MRSSSKRPSMRSSHSSSSFTPKWTTSALGCSGTQGTPSFRSSCMTFLYEPASPRSITGGQFVEVGRGLRSPRRTVVAVTSPSIADSVSDSLLILLLFLSSVSIAVSLCCEVLAPSLTSSVGCLKMRQPGTIPSFRSALIFVIAVDLSLMASMVMSRPAGQ